MDRVERAAENAKWAHAASRKPAIRATMASSATQASPPRLPWPCGLRRRRRPAASRCRRAKGAAAPRAAGLAGWSRCSRRETLHRASARARRDLRHATARAGPRAAPRGSAVARGPRPAGQPGSAARAPVGRGTQPSTTRTRRNAHCRNEFSDLVGGRRRAGHQQRDALDGLLRGEQVALDAVRKQFRRCSLDRDAFAAEALADPAGKAPRSTGWVTTSTPCSSKALTHAVVSVLRSTSPATSSTASSGGCCARPANARPASASASGRCAARSADATQTTTGSRRRRAARSSRNLARENEPPGRRAPARAPRCGSRRRLRRSAGARSR